MTLSLAEAQEIRLNAELDALLDQKLVGMAAPISPHAKFKLRDILKHYAKMPHPFRACVKDNLKRFGPGRVEAVCATLKDTIVGNKNWRKGGGHSKLSEEDLAIDSEILLALDHMSEVDLQEIFLEARALEEHGTVEAVALLQTDGKSELTRWGNRV